MQLDQGTQTPPSPHALTTDGHGSWHQTFAGLSGVARGLSSWLGLGERQPAGGPLSDPAAVEQRLSLHVDPGWGEASRRWATQLSQLPGFQEVVVQHLELKPRPRHGRTYGITITGLPPEVKSFVKALRAHAARTPAWHVDLRQG